MKEIWVYERLFFKLLIFIDKIKFPQESKLVSSIKCWAHGSTVTNSDKLLSVFNYFLISHYFLSFRCFSQFIKDHIYQKPGGERGRSFSPPFSGSTNFYRSGSRKINLLKLYDRPQLKLERKRMKKQKKKKEYLLQNVDKTSEERKNNAVSLALVTREDKDTLSVIDFIQKGSDIKQNNLKERETISETEIDEIWEQNEIGEIDKGEKIEEKKRVTNEKKKS